MKIQTRIGLLALATGFAGIQAAAAQTANDAFPSGFYLGASLGGANAKAKTSASTNIKASNTYFTGTDPDQIASAGDGRLKESQFSGGVFGGYNQRFGALFAGLEASLHSLSLDDSRSNTATYLTAPPNRFTLNQSISADWEGTLRLRLGVTQQNWQAYLTGGLAVSRIKASTVFTDNYVGGASGSDSTTKTKTGAVLGGGAEYAFSKNFSLRGEYLYTDFGKVDTDAVVTNPSYNATQRNTVNSSVDLKTHLFSVGLVYRF